MSTYFLILISSFSVPFIASFDKRIQFYKEWKFLIPALVISAISFIIWDIYFTKLGIWGFNPLHLQGVFIKGLPIEEMLFFIAIPYASIFTYFTLNKLIKTDYLTGKERVITLFLIFVFTITAILNYDKLYTSITLILAAILLLLHFFVFKSSYLSRFFFAYLIILIPFLIVNGILTGSFIEQEVVWYNNSENLGIRIFTIPIEDSVYGFLLLLLNITIYEKLKSKKTD